MIKTIYKSDEIFDFAWEICQLLRRSFNKGS